MRQSTGSGWHPPIAKVITMGLATAAVSAVGAVSLTPAWNSTVLNVLPTAAIDDSASTIGFADSDLYFDTPAQVDQQLDAMQALGVNDVRILIPWAGVEPAQGLYNWTAVDQMVDAANARGMGVLGVINSSPTWAVASGVPPISGEPASATQYADFASTVASRYAGKVSAYEVWNEPNSAASYAPQPDPANYTALLKAAYPAIKAADPTATVIGGVVGAGVDYGNYAMNPVTFVKDMYADGAAGYFDALSYHPYQYTTEFSQGGYLPDSPINQVAAIHNLMVANGDATKQIWASEYGEPTSVVSQADQASYLQDMLTTWRTLGYTGPSFVYTLQDRNTDSTDPEDTFGVIQSDGTLKPAAYVIKQLASESTTTPAIAQMALALPDAQSAAPADVATLTKLAATDPTAAAAVTDPTTAATAPTATDPPANPLTAMVANMQLAAQTAVANMQLATQNAVAAAGQMAQNTAQDISTVMASMTPATATTPTVTVPSKTATAPAAALAAVPDPTPTPTTAALQSAAAADATATAATAATTAAAAKTVAPQTPATVTAAPTQATAAATPAAKTATPAAAAAPATPGTPAATDPTASQAATAASTAPAAAATPKKPAATPKTATKGNANTNGTSNNQSQKGGKHRAA